jgi:hypothetical protein
MNLKFYQENNSYTIIIRPSKELANHLNVTVAINFLRPDFVSSNVDIPESDFDKIQTETVPMLTRLCLENFVKGGSDALLSML